MDIRELETPCYVINEEIYDQNIRTFQEAFDTQWGKKVLYGYSVKTNNFPYMLKHAMTYGFYAEVVSPDEWEFAERCGCTADRMIYNGPQKQDGVLKAIEQGAIVNLDNLEEVQLVCEAYRDKTVKPEVGLRVNFDLEKMCPGETTCEGIPGRFGICLENGDFAAALQLLSQSGIALAGLHMHQSSKTRSLAVFQAIAQTAAEIGKRFQLKLNYVDIGGGFFGGSYFPNKPAPDEYAVTVCKALKQYYDPAGTMLVVEPGAAILATSTDYLTSVLNIREVRGKRIVTVDGSLLHINPSLKPHPTPFQMINPGLETDREQIVGGSTCMELDRFWPRDIHQEIQHDSRLLFYCCGAYMSTHNSYFINAAPNIYLHKNGDYVLVRKKSIDALFL